MSDPEELEVAVRGWATPTTRSWAGTGERVDLGPSGYSVVFDTETTVDAAQRLRFGAYQVRHRGLLLHQGLFYDPDALTARELLLLRHHTDARGWRLTPVWEFITDVLIRYGWDLRGEVIGHNLPFDISRIAIGHHTTRTRVRVMRGGFAFDLTDDATCPTIQVKRASGKASFIRWGQPPLRLPEARNEEAGGNVARFDGYFIDTHTLAGALLSDSYSLGRLAEVLGTKHQKSDPGDFDRPLDPEMLDYGMNDVQVTWEVYEKLRDRYLGYGLDTPYWKILSEASVGKAHLAAMGLKPWRQTQPGVPDWVIAAILESYYGGRAETRIRRHAVPGVLVDFASQYPTAYTLQGLWAFQIAESITWEWEIPTRVQALLDRVTVDDVLDPALWLELACLLVIKPDGDLLPTRAHYSVNPNAALNVGLARRVSGPPQIYCLADAVTSKLETGKAPKVKAVLRFTAGPPQQGLQPLEVAGNPEYRVDPYVDDAIRRFVELRGLTKTHKTQAKADGDDLLVAELEAVQAGLKIAANATSYGIGIELNIQPANNPTLLDLHYPDGNSEPVEVRRVEEPGSWFHPLIATLTAAGGRLMLAAAMTLLHQAGGEYVSCDTDGLFIAATPQGGIIECPSALGGQIRALSWEQVAELCERFRALNPYDPAVKPGSILEIEPENYHDGQQRELWCWSIAAKRYALYQTHPDRIEIIKRSEHGLGHFLGPGDEEEDWIGRWWQHLISLELGIPDPEPPWLDAPAVGRIQVASTTEAATFTPYNQERPYGEQVRPFGFLNIAHPTPAAYGRYDIRCLIGPHRIKTQDRMQGWWFDRHHPGREPFSIHTGHHHRDGSIPVKSYRDYLASYRVQPEAKAADHTGGRSHTWTQGLLQPRTIQGSRLVRVGKEANRLTDHGLILDTADRAHQYIRHCHNCGTPLQGRQQRWCSEPCRKQHQRGTA